MRTRIAVSALLVALVTTAVALAATKKITPERVGGVKVGMTFEKARANGLVGPKRAGCPLSGRDTASARLKAPLEGSVELTVRKPRRVRSIQVRGGARARGVGIGSTIRQIKAAFPKARVERGTEETFGITLVEVPKDGGGKIDFAVDTDTKKTTLIGVPYIAFCE